MFVRESVRVSVPVYECILTFILDVLLNVVKRQIIVCRKNTLNGERFSLLLIIYWLS